jgi:hypothetical protein
MSLQNPSRRRSDDKHEFPAGLVILGFLLVAVIWLGGFRPQFLDFLFPPSVSPSATAPASREASQQAQLAAPPAMQPVPQPVHPVAQAAAMATESTEEKRGDFYRYTDDQGVVHMMDNQESIPVKYRQQVKVYKDTSPATRVRIVGNQVLVPVTLRNGQRSVETTLLLDAGCTVTSISEVLAARLEIDPNRMTPGTARVADGRAVPTRQVVIDRVTAGPKTKAPLEVSVMASAGLGEHAEGLLGMNFLRDFRYQLDIPGQQIHWH